MKRIVLIYWDDACGPDGWCKKDFKLDMAKCTTIGFVVTETDNFIAVTSTVAMDHDTLAPITIPKSCITDQWEISFD